MNSSNSTCWLLIRGAARGERREREEFARRYEPVVRAYLGARWRASPRLTDLDDAVQEVFVACFERGGVLESVERGHPGGFRAFLYGAARLVAWRFERDEGRRARREGANERELVSVPDDTEPLSRAFDRAWAEGVVREARRLLEDRAETAGPEAFERVELLRLRFQDGLPIRAIAERWGTDPARLHKVYAKARDEFREALAEVATFHHPSFTRPEIESECLLVLEALQG